MPELNVLLPFFFEIPTSPSRWMRRPAGSCSSRHRFIRAQNCSASCSAIVTSRALSGIQTSSSVCSSSLIVSSWKGSR